MFKTKKNLLLKLFTVSKVTVIFITTSLLFYGCKNLSKTEFDNQSTANEKTTGSQIVVANKVSTQISNIDSDFESNRKKWNDTKLSNYKMVISIFVTSFSSPAEPVIIEVKDNKAISVKPSSDSDKRSVGIYDAYDTVDKLFEMIQNESNKGATVTVKYDNEFGYPNEIIINYLRLGMFGGQNIEISKFEIVKWTPLSRQQTNFFKVEIVVQNLPAFLL